MGVNVTDNLHSDTADGGKMKEVFNVLTMCAISRQIFGGSRFHKIMCQMVHCNLWRGIQAEVTTCILICVDDLLRAR